MHMSRVVCFHYGLLQLYMGSLLKTREYLYIYIVKFSTLHKLWDFSYIIRQRSFFISFVDSLGHQPRILLLVHEVC